MTIQDTIKEMEIEFDDRYEGIFNGDARKSVKSFIHSYTQKLLKSVEGEILKHSATIRKETLADLLDLLKTK